MNGSRENIDVWQRINERRAGVEQRRAREGLQMIWEWSFSRFMPFSRKTG